MLWKTSPSLTELETVALRWLRDCLGLPDNLFGIINDTASINSFLGLAAAREAIAPEIRLRGFTGRNLPPLRVYCSEHAHSSIEKAALALGFGANGVVKIPGDDEYRMRPDALEDAIARDRRDGAVPCAISATSARRRPRRSIRCRRSARSRSARSCGCTSTPPTPARRRSIPEYRWLWKGIERADSIVVNPHKWLFTPIDCSVLYTRHPETLRNAFSLAEAPAYLTLTDNAEVNYMDYGLQLGRRFRALKLWMVMEHYGIERLRAVIRDQIGFAQRLAAELQKRDDVELLAPQSFSVVVFRKKASDEENAALLDRINASGKLFVSHTKLKGKYGIRVAIGNGATEWRHVAQILSISCERETEFEC